MQSCSGRLSSLGAGRLSHPANLHCSPYYTAQFANMLGLVAAMIVFWICWPLIEWCIGTVAWLASWYASVAECLPMLQ
jgi:hypothetical protein